jgi:hypothetical protein
VQFSGWFLAEDRRTPYDGSASTPNPLHERTRIHVWLFTADVRLRKTFGVQFSVTVPDVTRSAGVAGSNDGLPFSETFRGLGDMSALAWHRRVIRGWNVTFNGGLSLPTGQTERPRFRDQLDDDSLVPVSRLQRGTGTFDPVFGVTANRSFSAIFPPGTRIFATAAVRLNVAENAYGLRTGPASEIGAGGSREVYWHQLVVIARLSWLHRQQDEFEGLPVLVGGGDWLYFSPAAAVSFGAVTVQAEIKLPLYRSLANRQLDAARSVQVGVIWSPF